MTTISNKAELISFYNEAEKRALPLFRRGQKAVTFKIEDREVIAQKLAELNVDLHGMATTMAGKAYGNDYCRHLARLKKFEAERQEGEYRMAHAGCVDTRRVAVVIDFPEVPMFTPPKLVKRSDVAQAFENEILPALFRLGYSEGDVNGLVSQGAHKIRTTQKLDGVAERLAKEMLIHELNTEQKQYVLNRTRVLTA